MHILISSLYCTSSESQPLGSPIISMNQIVTTPNEVDAAIIKGFLEENGIQASTSTRCKS